MPRRPESAKLIAAREKLRARHEAQQSAVAAFFDSAARLDDLQAQVEELEGEQAGHTAALAATLGVPTTAELTGWSRSRIADAQRSVPGRVGAPRRDGPDTAVQNAVSSRVAS